MTQMAAASSGWQSPMSWGALPSCSVWLERCRLARNPSIRRSGSRRAILCWTRGMPVPSPMPTGLGQGLTQAMGSATVQGIGAIRSVTMGFRMGPTGQRASDGMADMEVSVRHVHRLVRQALGRPYLPIRHRGLEKATEWSARSAWRDLLLVLACDARKRRRFCSARLIE